MPLKRCHMEGSCLSKQNSYPQPNHLAQDCPRRLPATITVSTWNILGEL